MASLTSAINVQVDAKVKKEATRVLKDLGLNMSTAINMFLVQVVKKDGIPFEVYNEKEEDDLYKFFTKKELKEAAKELAYMEKHPEKYPRYNNREDLKKALLSDD